MFEENVKVHAQNTFGYGAVEIYFYIKGLGDERLVGQPVEFKATDVAAIAYPTIRLERDSAQLLMDALWDCGLRPSEGSGSAGALAATQKHLADTKASHDDMGKLAARLLNEYSDLVRSTLATGDARD